jgi:hypothetical protein
LIINASNQALVRYPARRVTHKAPVILVKPQGETDPIDYVAYVQHVARQNPNAMVYAVLPSTVDPINNVLLLSRLYLVLRRRLAGVVPRNLVLLITPSGALVEEWFVSGGFTRFSYWFQYKIVYYNYNRITSTGFFIPCTPLPLGKVFINCRNHQLECAKSLRAFVNRAHSELGASVPILLPNCPKRVLGKSTRVFDLRVFL